MKKSVVFMMVFIALIFVRWNLVSAEDAAVLDARNSVVRIYKTYLLEGNDFASYKGSGFCVGEKNKACEYVMTNKHVVVWEDTDALDELQKFLTKNYPSHPEYVENYINIFTNNVTFRVFVLADGDIFEVNYEKDISISQNADLALIRLPEPIRSRKPIALGESSALKSTDDVFALGFPGIGDVDDTKLISNTSSLETLIAVNISSDIKNITTTKGTISKTNVIKDGVSHVQHTADISGGNSGGPLVSESGYVVGINTWMSIRTAQATKTMYSIEVDEIKNFLRQNNVPWFAPSSGMQNNTLLIASIVGIVIIGATAFLLINKRKPAREKNNNKIYQKPDAVTDYPARDYSEPVRTASSSFDINTGDSLFSFAGDLTESSSKPASSSVGSSSYSYGSSSDPDDSDDSTDFTFTSSL